MKTLNQLIEQGYKEIKVDRNLLFLKIRIYENQGWVKFYDEINDKIIGEMKMDLSRDYGDKDEKKYIIRI